MNLLNAIFEIVTILKQKVKELKNIRVIAIHVIAWIGVFAIPELFRPDMPGFQPRFVSIHHIITFNLPLIGFFYLNAYFLIPNLLRKKSPYIYILAVLGIIILMVLTESWMKSFSMPAPARMRPPRGGRGELRMFFMFPLLFMWAISTSYRFFIDQLKTDRENKERENIHLKTELSFLRSQISPHFIFNILNSLVALSRKRPQQVEPVIIQLSDMMRYMLYENDEKKVSVSREIEYLENYIDLQKLRFGDLVKINFSVYNNAGAKMIEPMLLIPFIENAFKHGVGLINNPVIDIHLRAEGNELAFTVQNRYNDADQKDDSSGIGLKNVERRLKILYDKRHQLRLSKDDEWFNVDLKIELE